MTRELGSPDDLIADYVRSGWNVVDPQKRRADIDFLPDYLLRKGDDYLVVEVKQPGRKSDRSVAEMRRIVENQPHWHFAVKLRPGQSLVPRNDLAEENVHPRLTIAEQLLASGHRDEAILIAWVAIETSLRRLVSDTSDVPTDLSLPALLRSAYEAEAISDPELRQIDRARSLRNQIVHGFRAQVLPNDAEGILSLTKALSERVDAIGSKPSP